MVRPGARKVLFDTEKYGGQLKSGSLKVTQQGEEPRPNTKASAPSIVTLSFTVFVYSLSFLPALIQYLLSGS